MKKYDSYNPAELHSQDIMKYEELSLSELMGKEVVEIIPQTEGKGTVSPKKYCEKGKQDYNRSISGRRISICPLGR